MIVAVDDEELYRILIEDALRSAGFEVVTFARATQALEAIPTLQPELIISDIRMPGMDGLAFKAALAEQMPTLDVPFVFLSSLNEPEQIVAGLDTQADDYLVKPIDPRVLVAKVTAILARSRRSRNTTFQGDLARFPFVRLLQFCEQHALNGVIELHADTFDAAIPIRAGQIVFDELEDAEELLEHLYDLDRGSFVIHQHVADLAELESIAPAEPTSATKAPTRRWNETQKSAGMLSALDLEGRTFQVQTELVSLPEPSIETTVAVGGKVVLKRQSLPPASEGTSHLKERIASQHAEIEEEIRRRVMELVAQKAERPQGSGDERFYELFEQGLEAFQRHAFDEAIAVWEQARELRPEDATLAVNLKIAQAKLEKSRGTSE